MIKKRLTTLAVAVGALALGVWSYQRADAETEPTYRLAQVERGTIQRTVSATGTVGAVQTVQVGTQVSGQVSAIFVDYNDKVKKGRLLARIDPTLLQQAVQDARAGVARVQAQLTQSKLEYERTKTLHEQKIITDAEFDTAASNYAVARANLSSAQIALDKARQNLSYTDIHAPIDGVVIERNVDVGVTVAASLQAPQLFLIANDLSRMQILASVDESDIGLIKAGQPVTFTVQAYRDEDFAGRVRQVRLKDSTSNNVVSYTAVVEVENPNGKLLPGMTATVKFVTDSAANALTVPNAALRFRPATGLATSSSGSGPAQPASGGAVTGTGTGTGTVHTLDAGGTPVPHRVEVGISDGQRTQIEDTDLVAGAGVVIGSNQGAEASANRGGSGSSNPLQTSQQRAPGPPGPF